jgi:hypothetical protein
VSSSHANETVDRLHLLGIRHHGPGSAALLRNALDALEPACVLIEGPPEGDALIPYVAGAGMKPPVAMLLHATENPKAAIFMPFAEFSPEWQAMRWALERNRPARFIDWPAAVSIALKEQEREAEAKVVADGDGPETTAGDRGDVRELARDEARRDALDLLAEAAGYDDGESFWNALIEQHGNQGGEHARTVFASIETAMAEARAAEERAGGPVLRPNDHARDLRREAFMRMNIRAALKEHEGTIALVCGAWHVSALRAHVKAAEDKALVKDLPRLKVDATWVPWTDARLSAGSGYGAGVISPGWYRHLWSLYSKGDGVRVEEFAALWQSRTAHLLRAEGHNASTASAIESARLALGLAAMRELPMPGLAEMREASLATLCYGEPLLLGLIERKLYIGESIGEIDERVPQMPLARDLALWQRKTRLKPEALQQEVRLDLRSDAGLLKSTLLHRLNLIHVPWGKLIDAQHGRGTFREVWTLQWEPELSVALAEALIYGVTIEQAAGNATLEGARAKRSVKDLAELVQAALIADLPAAAIECINLLQAAAVADSDMTDLMLAVSPLARVLRYGAARELPEVELRALVRSIAVEINAGIVIGSRMLDAAATMARAEAAEAYDQALTLFADPLLMESWSAELHRLVEDEQVVSMLAGVALRRLHDRTRLGADEVAAAFARHTQHRTPQHGGDFLEGFLRGGSEVLLQDEPLLHLVDAWLCALTDDEFMAALPLLRRSTSGFDESARRRLLEKIKRGARESLPVPPPTMHEVDPAFAAALPLLYKILGVGEPG